MIDQIPKFRVCCNVRFEGVFFKIQKFFKYCKYTTGDIQPWYVLWTYYKAWSGHYFWKPLPFLSRCQPINLLTSRFVKMNWSSKYTMLILLLILATSTWGYSKLLGGGVPKLDIDHSGPSISPLLLHTLIIWPAPPSPPYIGCPASAVVAFYLPPSPPPKDHLPTWASHCQ